MANFYHGTDWEKAEAIQDEGFRGSELDELTVGRHVDGGVVFLTDDIELAKDYGDTVIIVSTEFAKDFKECEATGLKEYYVKVSDLEDDGAWWIND